MEPGEGLVPAWSSNLAALAVATPKLVVGLQRHLGSRLIAGIVFYVGQMPLSFGDRLRAWPISTLLGSGAAKLTLR